MKHRLSPFLAAMLLFACQNKTPYKIIPQERTLLDDEHCLVVHSYPEIRGIRDSMTAIGINQYLREALQLKRRIISCLDDSLGERTVLLGDYSVQQISADFISLELRLSAQNRGQKQVYFFPASFNMPEAYNPPLELLLGEDILVRLRPLLESWKAQEPGRDYNQYAYYSGSNYAIPFCLSADSLILYPGAEGELLATQRLSIALDELNE